MLQIGKDRRVYPYRDKLRFIRDKGGWKKEKRSEKLVGKILAVERIRSIGSRSMAINKIRQSLPGFRYCTHGSTPCRRAERQIIRGYRANASFGINANTFSSFLPVFFDLLCLISD